MDLTEKAIDEADARFKKWAAGMKTQTIRVRVMTDAELEELSKEMALLEYGWQRRN